MGGLARFNLVQLSVRYSFGYFVETGTGLGASLDHAAAFNFRTLHSCDVDPIAVQNVKQRYLYNNRVFIELENSSVFLEGIFERIPQTSPILFWLDAHFPGCFTGPQTGEVVDADIRLPLAEELQLIAQHRPMGMDIIAIDDLRIYTEGPFTSGSLPDELRPLCPAERNIDFVYDIMGKTHDVECFYEHEGYMLLTPKVYLDVN